MNNFQIKTKLENLIFKVYQDVLINVSHTHTGLRVRLSDSMFNLHNNIIMANLASSPNKILQYKNEALSNIYTIDLILGLIRKLGFLENKKFMSLIKELNELIAMIKAWMQNETKKN